MLSSLLFHCRRRRPIHCRQAGCNRRLAASAGPRENPRAGCTTGKLPLAGLKETPEMAKLALTFTKTEA